MKWGLHFDPARLRDEIEELEQRAGDPTFWDDIQKSQEILQKIKQLKTRLSKFDTIETLLDDASVLLELALEADDESQAGEIGANIKEASGLLDELKTETMLNQPYDRNNAFLTLHAGAGGTEAMDWVEMLLRMYTRWCEKKGYQVKVLDVLDGEEAGIKSAAIQVVGDNAYGMLRSEKGVHRLVRISPFDASGRRHTSFASLDVMPEMDEEIKIEINPDDLKVDTYRSSGAGGQHINKTESAIRITHIPTGVTVSCQTERSQIQNREYAMKMLKAKLFEIKEREHKEKIEDLSGVMMDIAWGSQIRSYVFCPYTLVKDHRTDFENGNVQAVMDGDLDGFINAYLAKQV